MTFVRAGSHTIWVSGLPLRPERATTLILVHGAGGSRLQWPRELRLLPGVNVLAVDLPGHGRSAGPAPTSLEAHAAVLGEALRELGADSVILVGHSMGGGVALALALAQPARAAGLVLMAAGATLPVPAALVELARTAPEAAARQLAALAWGDDAPEAVLEPYLDSVGTLPPVTLARDLAACAAFDARDRLAGLGAPVLILGGKKDRLIPEAVVEHLGHAVANAKLHWIEAGHMLTLEEPQAVADAVKAWLARQSS